MVKKKKTDERSEALQGISNHARLCTYEIREVRRSIDCFNGIFGIVGFIVAISLMFVAIGVFEIDNQLERQNDFLEAPFIVEPEYVLNGKVCSELRPGWMNELVDGDVVKSWPDEKCKNRGG